MWQVVSQHLEFMVHKYMSISKIYPWIKLFLSGLLFIAYDYFKIDYSTFIAMFIAIEILMIISDIYLHFKRNVKISNLNIILYVFYNFIAIKILINF